MTAKVQRNMPGSRAAIARDSDALEDAGELLGRYPEVSSEELDRIGRFLRHGAPIDIGLLSSNPPLWKAAERFRAEHPRYFALGLWTYAWWILALAAIPLCLLLIKDMGLD